MNVPKFHLCRSGPDDDLAAPELCAPDRPCFAQSSTVLAPQDLADVARLQEIEE